MKIIKISEQKYNGKRIDIVLPLINNFFSRSQIQKLIKEQKIIVNNVVVKNKYLIKLNDEIKILDFDDKQKDLKLKPENIKLDIIFEDEDLLVINKPRGMVVHPGNGNYKHTLVNALLFYTKNLSSINQIRPGIVHRIDKNTSGLLLVAKNNFVHRKLSLQLEHHTIKREYKALVNGLIKEDKGKIIAPISRSKINPLKMTIDVKNGKEAETYFSVIKRFKNVTLVKINLKQGRTHQIRVHFEYINHPIVGDLLYSANNKNISDGQILHAYKISFFHPRNNKKMVFTVQTPKYFLDAIKFFN